MNPWADCELTLSANTAGLRLDALYREQLHAELCEW